MFDCAYQLWSHSRLCYDLYVTIPAFGKEAGQHLSRDIQQKVKHIVPLHLNTKQHYKIKKINTIFPRNVHLNITEYVPAQSTFFLLKGTFLPKRVGDYHLKL
jgi:hypothetical protein